MNEVHFSTVETSGQGGLATLHLLGCRARGAASPAELGFILANESFQLAPYRQAALWLRDRGVTTLSGISQPDLNAPYVQWLGSLCPILDEKAGGQPFQPQPFDLPTRMAVEWEEWLPAHGLWLPLPGPDGQTGGGLLLTREEAWHEAETALLAEWIGIWHHAWKARTANDMPSRLAATARQILDIRAHARALSPGQIGHTLAGLRQRKRLRYLLAVAAVLVFPVRLSVLAPGELVPAHPHVIRAPMDGVVDQVQVQPNQRVKAGDALFALDRASLDARLAVASQALATSQTEYRQQAQQALFDARSKSRLATVQGGIGEKEAEVGYLRQQSERATLTAPVDGIVLMTAPSEWIGRPVVTGERLATLATEGDEELEAWLALGDAIDLAPGAPVTLYLNTSPLDPVEARLRYVAHEAQQRPDGSFAYRLRADLAEGSPRPRIGLKGTVKVSGEHVPLAWWLLRRPLAAARQFVGL